MGQAFYIPGRLAILAAAILLSAAFLPQQDAAHDARLKFDHDPNPQHRAKMLPQLGNLEFQDIHNLMSAGNYDEALKTLELYRDQATSTEKGLNASGPDATKHSTGYRQLEISVREALRRIDDLFFGVPADQKKAFSDIRDELDQLDRRLIRQLFPRDQPAGQPSAQPGV